MCRSSSEAETRDAVLLYPGSSQRNATRRHCHAKLLLKGPGSHGPSLRSFPALPALPGCSPRSRGWSLEVMKSSSLRCCRGSRRASPTRSSLYHSRAWALTGAWHTDRGIRGGCCSQANAPMRVPLPPVLLEGRSKGRPHLSKWR